MKSYYKWTLSTPNEVCYIANETDVFAFIYNTSTKKRISAAGEEANKPVSAEGETKIDSNACHLTEAGYANAFNAMVILLDSKGYGSDAVRLANDGYRAYFNTDESACYDAGDGVKCPKLVFDHVVAVDEMSARTELVKVTYEPDGTPTYHYDMYVPKGPQGAQGSRGSQGTPGQQGPQGQAIVGPQGARGEEGVQGEDGFSPEAYYTSFIFKKSNSFNPQAEYENLCNAQPSNVPGYEGKENPYYNFPMRGYVNGRFYDEYITEELGWSDTVPVDDGQGNKEAKVWMTKKIFSTNNTDWGTYDWAMPSEAADSSNAEFEWNVWTTDPLTQEVLTLATLKEKYPPMRQSPDDEHPNFTRDYTGGTLTVEEWLRRGKVDNHGWHDDPVEGAVWMGTIETKNGVYTANDWELSRIKGEDGDAGEPFTIGEEWAGDLFYHATLKPSGRRGSHYNEAHACSSDSTYTGVSEQPFKKGHLYIWDGDSWEDGGMFTGKNAYLHIKYANAVSGSDPDADNCIKDYFGPGGHLWLEWTGESGETPDGEYTGMLTDDNESDPQIDAQHPYNGMKLYKWSYTKGADGFGYEYVFCRVNSDIAPDLPESEPAGSTGGYWADGVYHDGEAWSTGGTEYQKHFDFIPKTVRIGNQPVTGAQWTDDILSPTRDLPCVYEIFRKRNEDGSWTGWKGEGNKAALKNRYVISPEFKSTIFKRSNTYYEDDNARIAERNRLVSICATDEGGTYENPVPTSGGWSDGVPEGDGVLWMCVRTMSKDPLKQHITDPTSIYTWGDIKLSEDGKDLEYEWLGAKNPDNPSSPNYEDMTPTEIASYLPLRTSPDDDNPGTAYTNGHDATGWYDNPIAGAVWMAQCNIYGGEYERKNGSINWQISRIKGEKGDPGFDSYTCDLTNENDGVCLGDDAILDVEVKLTTEVYLIKGKTTVALNPNDVILGSTSGISARTYKEGALHNGVVVEFTLSSGITFLQDGKIVPKEIGITVTSLEENVSFNKIFTITGIPGGKDGDRYQLHTSTEAIVFDENKVPSQNTISTTAYLALERLYKDGSTKFCGYDVVYTKGSASDNIIQDATTLRNSSYSMDYSNGTWTVHEAITSALTRVILYLVNTGCTQIYDWETIPFSYDGEQGPQGDRGAQGPQGPAGGEGSTKLDDLFAVVEGAQGAYLRQFIGVCEHEIPASASSQQLESDTVAFMNGHSNLTVGGETIMLAAGCNSGTTIGQRAASAAFQVLADGNVKLTNHQGETKVLISPMLINIDSPAGGIPINNTASSYHNISSGCGTVLSLTGYTMGTAVRGSKDHINFISMVVSVHISVDGSGEVEYTTPYYTVTLKDSSNESAIATVTGSTQGRGRDATVIFNCSGLTGFTQSGIIVELSGSTDVQIVDSAGPVAGMSILNFSAMYTTDNGGGRDYGNTVKIGLNGLQVMYNNGSNLTVVDNNGVKIQGKVAKQGNATNGWCGFYVDETGMIIFDGHSTYAFNPSNGTFGH